MAEWAAVDQYQASTPQTLVIPIPDFNFAFPVPHQVEIYQTQPPRLWRMRFFSVFGTVSNGVGTVQLTLGGFISGLVGDPWTNGGPLLSTAPASINPTEDYHFTWSPDIGNSYSGLNVAFGRTANTALPLLFLPGLTDFTLAAESVGGFAGTFTILGGQMELESFPPDALSGEGANDQGEPRVYLLPAAKAGAAGGFA